ncbi:hypothetical protein EIP86_005709 [Pleurotus ostreatoroseus]|nr:hypothetical protein EIP86_005709 [Pleurotus ostreatoroseus]
MVTVLFPFIRSMYNSFMQAVREWALGPQHAELAHIRRIEWALLGGGDAAQLRVEIDEDRNRDGRQGQNNRQRQQRRGAGARRDGNANGNQGDGEQADEELDDAAVAEQTIRVNGASIGRFVGGALMLPTVAKYMGSVLLHLSGRSSWLRAFLAVRPHAHPTAAFPRSWFQDAGKPMSVGQLGMSMRVVFNLICGGTKTWAESDPVW